DLGEVKEHFHRAIRADVSAASAVPKARTQIPLYHGVLRLESRDFLEQPAFGDALATLASLEQRGWISESKRQLALRYLICGKRMTLFRAIGSKLAARRGDFDHLLQ